ncbi:MAG: sigma-70 family RNA polymerase sigma factor [Myxococcales bacterium]|nr:sigma-70 family RNA polymerase sigma factor [Myxococcales bacterium]
MNRRETTARPRPRPRSRTREDERHDLGTIRGFARMHRACYRYVWVVLANLGVPEAQLDDAHQEVFVTCYRRRDSYHADRPIKPWLVGIARRVAFRYRRSEQRAQRKHSEFTRERGGPRSDLRGQVEARILLDQVLERLDPQRREVLILSELEGRTGPEIAEELGIHLDAAYSRLRSARKALTRVFTTIEEEPLPRAEARQAFAALLPQLALPSAPLPWIAAWGAKAKAAAGIVAVTAIAAVAAPAIDLSSPATAAASGGPSRAGVTEGSTADTSHMRSVDEAVEPEAVDDDHVYSDMSEDEGGAERALRRAPRRSAATEPTGGEAAEALAESPDDGADPSTLGEEARLLARAKRALTHGAAADALAPLDEHARRFRDGPLAEAREGLRIDALCALGRRREARGIAAALRRDYPDSSLAWRLADPCPLSPADDGG